MTATAVAEPPDVDEAREAVEELRGHRDKLREELRGIQKLVDPNFHDRPQSRRPDRLRARAREPEVRSELDRVEADLEEAQQVLSAAQEAEKERRRARAREQLKPLVQALDSKLSEAAEIVGEMQPLDAEAGVRVTDAWALLLDEYRREGVLSTWRRYCEQEGLME